MQFCNDFKTVHSITLAAFGSQLGTRSLCRMLCGSHIKIWINGEKTVTTYMYYQVHRQFEIMHLKR